MTTIASVLKPLGALLAMIVALAVAIPVRAQDEAPTTPVQTGPRLDFPAGLATDGRTVYAASSRNNTVNAIDIASRSIQPLVGKSFQEGSNDGTGDAARFNSPDGMTIVGQNLYLCDTNNSDVRQINIGTRVVSTVVGTANISGSEDGKAEAAHFNLPTQIATDGTSLYVADSGNDTIRRITIADWSVKTIGGQPQTTGNVDGPPAKSQFNQPRGIATDGKSVFVADTGNDVIRKIDLSTMTSSTIAGTGETGDADGPGNKAQFSNPGALCTDGTILYVLDADNHAIRKINIATNDVTKLTLVNGHLGSGCAITSDGKQLYFSDTTENSVQVVDTTSGNFQPLYPPNGQQ
jgi:DNA-binding beta-propeller fold protein YncE